MPRPLPTILSAFALAVALLALVVSLASLAADSGTVMRDDSLRLENRGDDYALKVDHAGSGDAVNVASAAEEGTALGVVGRNVTLSTVKVTNSAAQEAGAVVAAVGESRERVAPVFRAENAGSGASFDALATSGEAIGLRLKSHPEQRADLVQLKDARGVPLLGVDSGFRLYFDDSLAQETSPLPGRPAGYLVVVVGGEQVRIPFYPG